MANLKELFPEFYQTNLSSSDLSNKSKNIIVLDTNYLLDIIQLPIAVSKKYIEALEKIKDNIYVPYLVALEFNFKKSSIKKNKIKEIKKYKEHLEQSISKITSNINTIDLVDKNEKEIFTKDILDLTENYAKSLRELVEEKIESIITKEESVLYNRLIKIIEDKIGDKYEQEWISKVEEEGEIRYKKEIPPGFNDSSKEDEDESIRRYGDIEYQRKYGDLLIWKDIIEYSKECTKLAKKVVFVTNDGLSKKKADLLYKVDNLIVGPNIYLMNELQRESKKEFYILSNLRFVQLVNDLTDAEMSELETFTEPKLKFKFKIPLEKLDKTMEKINELNSVDDKLEYYIDDGYLVAKERAVDEDSIFNFSKNNLLKSYRNKFVHEKNKEKNMDIKKITPIKQNNEVEIDEKVKEEFTRLLLMYYLNQNNEDNTNE